MHGKIALTRRLPDGRSPQRLLLRVVAWLVLVAVLSVFPDRGALAQEARLVTARVTWGEGGSVRVIAKLLASLPERKEVETSVRFLNEGTLPLTIGGDDAFFLLTSDGKKVRLKPEFSVDGTPQDVVTLKPASVRSFWADLPKSASSAVTGHRWTSKALGRSVDIRTPWQDPRAIEVVAPTAPAEAVAGDRWVHATLHVGADGRVTGIGETRGEDALRPAAVTALRGWVFEPARENGAVIATLVSESLWLGDKRVVRLVFSEDPATIASRVDTALRREFRRIATGPHEDTRIAVGLPVEQGEFRGVRLHLLRWGPEPGGGTWLVAGAAGYQLASTFGCHMWTEQGSAVGDFGSWLSDHLGSPPRSISSLSIQQDAWLPSGLPEPPSEASWSSLSLARLAEASVRAGRDGPYDATWTEVPAPVPVLGDVRPPKLIRKIEPRHPDPTLAGNVILQVTIDEQGSVVEARLLKSAHARLNVAALAAVCQWKYEPATMRGSPVPVTSTVIVRFVD